MNIPNSTQDYLTDGAVTGERNDNLFSAACQCRDSGLSQHDAQTSLMSRALADGLPFEEVHRAIVSAFSRGAREPARAAGGPSRQTGRRRNAQSYKTAPKGDYTLVKRTLPEPIDDGARVLLNTAFNLGENVRIVFATVDKVSGKGRPANDGTTLSREWWIKKLDENGGNLDRYGKRSGAFIGINPLKIDGSRDQDVTQFRHALVEFDHLDLEEQYHLIVASRIPCTAVMSSGGRSLHAWVKVDAPDRATFDQRFKMLSDHLADWIDAKNKNPSRLSRLPNTVRLNNRQELLALNIGCLSWADWENEIRAEAVGELLKLRELATFDTENDPNNILGNRWICKGGSCLIVGQSGIGKSSLCLQLSLNWALGRTSFGITPERPLKSLIIQAENDHGDVSEMVQGSLTGLQINVDDDAFTALEKNVVIVTESVNTSDKFAEAVRHLIGAHKPDLVWLDPLLSFIGDDISRQEVCSHFLRNLLNPIAYESGVAWMMMHHTPKPAADPQSKSHWLSYDQSYQAHGSAELTNWCRAACLLRATKTAGQFQLILAKRGSRAMATNIDGSRTNVIHLQHSSEGILWEQIPEPVEVKVKVEPKEPKAKAAPKRKPTKKQLSKLRKDAGTKEIEDLDGLIARIGVPMTKKQIQELSEKHGHGSPYLVKKQWSEIELYLVKANGKYTRKPSPSPNDA